MKNIPPRPRGESVFSSRNHGLCSLHAIDSPPRPELYIPPYTRLIWGNLFGGEGWTFPFGWSEGSRRVRLLDGRHPLPPHSLMGYK